MDVSEDKVVNALASTSQRTPAQVIRDGSTFENAVAAVDGPLASYGFVATTRNFGADDRGAFEDFIAAHDGAVVLYNEGGVAHVVTYSTLGKVIYDGYRDSGDGTASSYPMSTAMLFYRMSQPRTTLVLSPRPN